MDMGPMTEDIPFPSMSGIVADRRVADIISPAYAAPGSELVAILQYVYHMQYFEAEGMNDVAHTYHRIFVAEMMHLDILGKMLIKLGVDPVYVCRPPLRQNFFTSSWVSYSKAPKQMLLDDINGEMRAIADYRLMITRLGGNTVGEMISRIVMDEEMHLKALKEIYTKIAQK